MEQEKKTFKAILFDKDTEKLGERIEIKADNLDTAVQILDQKYGKGRYIDLHNEEDADKQR